MEPRLNVALAGFGAAGQRFHAPFLTADRRFRLCKILTTRKLARERYPDAQTVSRFEELLTPEIDLVILATPNALHVPQAQQAVLAGKHVLVEKPIAATADEARALFTLAKERGVVLTVHQNRRFDGGFRTVQQLIERGDLGEVLDYAAHFDRYVTGKSPKPWKAAGGAGVNILYDIGIHLIDQAYVLFGMPQAVYADVRKHRTESPEFDAFSVNLYYGERKAVLSAGEVVAMPGPHFAVHGHRGSFLKFGLDPQEAALAAGQKPSSPHWGEDTPDRFGTLARVTETGIVTETVPTVPGNYALFFDAFYRAVTDNAPPPVQEQEAVDVLTLVEAALESAKTGKRVDLTDSMGKF